MNIGSGSEPVASGCSGAAALRPATTADLQKINDVIGRAVMRWSLAERVKRLALPSYHYRSQDLDHLRILVAEDEAGGLAGVAAWEPAAPRDCPPGRRGLLLHGLYVDPDRQGRGVGTRLLGEAAAAAREDGYDGLLVKAQADASGFFQTRGLERLLAGDSARSYANRFWLDLS